PSPVMVAALSIDPPSTAGLLTVTLKLSVAVPPAATVPTVKLTFGGGPFVNAHAGVHDPATNVVPGGIASVTTTVVAGTTWVGLDTVMVEVIVLPGVMNPFASAGGVTDAALEMVAAGRATSVCETVLLSAIVIPVAVALALLLIGKLPAAAGIFAVTTRVRVADPKPASVPTL